MECVSCHAFFQSTAFSPNKRSSSDATSPQQPTSKAMRQHQTKEHPVKRPAEKSDINWMIVTEQSLTSTTASVHMHLCRASNECSFVQLASELMLQSSKAERHETVSLMNACLDTLLKLKEFRRA